MNGRDSLLWFSGLYERFKFLETAAVHQTLIVYL